MVVPASALIFRQEGLEVAVVNEDSRVELKHVSVKADLGTQVEIGSGLSATDRVVDNPPDSLTSGDRVHVASTSPTPAQATAEADSNQTGPAHG